MELQAQVTALEEEVGMLKGEIKAILQEVRVAILARENPFLSDDSERPVPSARSINPFDQNDVAPAPFPAPFVEMPVASPPPSFAAPAVVIQDTAPRPQASARSDQVAPDESSPVLKTSKRPLDLAALMVWVQEAAETFNHPEFVMLVTMASYADFFDEGLKQALIDMSQQIAREHPVKASLADFSVSLKQLESIRASSSSWQRQAA